MVIADRELAGTIRFAMKATKELDLLDFHSQEAAVAKLGVELGHDVAKSLVSQKRKDTYAELATFWNESGLGSMVVVQTDPAILRLNGCYDCSSSRTRASPACSFKKSLIETIVQDSLGATVHAHELECCKSGGTGCVFRLKVG
jgi:predicted hydrocarbon binding protein